MLRDLTAVPNTFLSRSRIFAKFSQVFRKFFATFGARNDPKTVQNGAKMRNDAKRCENGSKRFIFVRFRLSFFKFQISIGQGLGTTVADRRSDRRGQPPFRGHPQPWPIEKKLVIIINQHRLTNLLTPLTYRYRQIEFQKSNQRSKLQNTNFWRKKDRTNLYHLRREFPPASFVLYRYSSRTSEFSEFKLSCRQ